MTVLDLAPDLANGPAREVRVLLQDPRRKLVLITLRGGAVLDDHSAVHPITVQCVAGAGRFRAEGQEIELHPGRVVAVDAGVVHAVASAPAVAVLVSFFRG